MHNTHLKYLTTYFRFDKGPAESSLTLNARNYDVRSDIWSVGITQVELARGRHPYVG